MAQRAAARQTEVERERAGARDRAAGPSPARTTAGSAAARVLRLQATAGNQAVGALLRPSDAGAGAMIQRLIGFEIETRIPIRYQDPLTNAVTKPKYNEVHANAGTGDSSELVVDKVGDDPIIELTTAPVDDRQSTSNFKNTARAWVAVLSDVRTQAASSPPLVAMAGKYTGAPANTVYGFQNASERASINQLAFQATHGLRLDKVAEYLSKMEYRQKIGSRFERKEEALHETEGAMDQVMTALTAVVDPRTTINKSSERTQAVKEVRGFLSLIAHYLLLGGKNIKAYIKNQMSLFYKSKLSSVYLALVASNTYAQALFDPGNRDTIKAELLKATGRTADQPVFTDGATKCGDWLEDVLSGADDPVFDEAKNAWASPIPGGTVKGHTAAVVEHRDITSEILVPQTTDLSNPDGVVKYLVAVFKANKKAQNL